MKKIGMKNKTGKVTAALILVLMLACAFATILVTTTEASDIPTLQSQTGMFNFGTAGISDPVKVDTGVGYYMKPASYVYLGEVYNSISKTYEPVICRVLDADMDNVGNSGAMFLYTENAIEPSRFYSGDKGLLDYIGTENIYPNSYLALAESEKYYLKSHYGRHFADVPEVEDYIRKVSKTDTKSETEGLYQDFIDGIDADQYPEISKHDFPFVFSFETDTLDENSEPYYIALPTDSVSALNNSGFFPLSAEEFNEYMGSLSSSANYSADYVLSGEGVAYWLRTGIYEEIDVSNKNEYLYSTEKNNLGNLVLGVDAVGNLIAIPAESTGVYGRFAFNLETDSISYNRVINGAHKLAFSDPRYAISESDLFSAEIINTADGVVTLKYTNAIRSRSTVWYGENESEYISVLIKDESGNVKSYASIAKVPQCYYESDEEKKSSEYFTAQFALPDDYDEEKDTIVVFWERKDDDERKPSFTSNRVELDCAHTHYNEDGTFDKLPTCSAQGSCVNCGNDFGEFDPNSHPNMESGSYEYDDAENNHWHICPDCGAAGEKEACQFIDYCIAPCVCGNLNENSEHHNYNSDGICTRDESHYEKPEMHQYGINVSVRVKNVGNWLWIADQIAKGKKQYALYEQYAVYVDSDLDFENVDFIPLGTSEHPFVGTVDSLGKKTTISNVTYSDTSGEGIGIIGVAENVTIVNINLQNISFEGKKSVGALVGKATNVDIEGVTVLGEINLSCTEGASGAFFGSADSDSSILLSFSYPTKDNAPLYLSASGSGAPTIDTSFFRAESDGDGGYISDSTFASGMVAYSFNLRKSGIGWRQTLDGDSKDYYPRRDGNGSYVRITEYCDGTPAVYTNNPRNEMIHNPVEVYSHEWKFSYNYCDLEALCDKCNEVITTPADVEIILESTKATHIASIVLNGVTEEIDRVVVFGVKLEDFIGMSDVTVTYTGRGISADELMTNHALHWSEYVAYFVNSETGEEYMYEDNWGDISPENVSDVGVYDIVIVGQYGTPWTQVGGNWTEDNTVNRNARDFSGQTVKYEKVLTILPAEVTITPDNVYKYYDGKSDFVPSWTIDNSNFYAEEFGVYFSDAESAEIGDYILNVTADTGFHGDNVKLTLAYDSVRGSIIENRNTHIENKNYPESFVYGEEITAPTAEHFDMTEGAEFSYQWFIDKSAYESQSKHLVALSGEPKNAGCYVLRAYAGSTDTLGASYVDVNVRIETATVKVSYIIAEDKEPLEFNYSQYIFIDSIDEIAIKLDGFVNGDSADSLGITAKAVIRDEASPINIYPSRKNVYITYEIEGNTDNYEFTLADNSTEYIYSIPGVGLPEIVKEEYWYDIDWSAGYLQYNWGFRYNFTWEHPIVDGFELDTDAGEHWLYSIYIYDISNGIDNKVETGIKNVQIGGSDRSYENYYAARTSKAGEYLIEIRVTAQDYLRRGIEIPGVENNTIYMYYYVVIEIENEHGELVDEINTEGKYTVTVKAYANSESYDSGTADKVTDYDFILAKEVEMNFKEIEYNISDGSYNFELEDIYKHVVMTAGGVFKLGHELSDVYISVNTRQGYAFVTGFKVVDSLGNDVSHHYEVANFDVGLTDHTGGGVATTHIFDTPCDAYCNVDGCGYTRNVSHSGDVGGLGNCTRAYVCENCGGAYMPDIVKHASSEKIIVRNGENTELHDVLYLCCGLVYDTEEHFSESGATCKSLAVCDGCQRSFGELDPTKHEKNPEYANVDAKDHSVTYSCCQTVYNEEHCGGIATCKELAVCTVCNSSYGELNLDNHVGTTQAEQDADNPEMHVKTYDCCGKKVQEAHFGGTATCLELAVCVSCEASYGTIDSEKHTSESLYYKQRTDNASMHDAYHSCCDAYLGKFYHSGGTATCSSGAICESCGLEYGDYSLSAHSSEEYVFVPDELDKTRHVKLYACCGEEVERIAHTFGTPDCLNGAVCNVCGAKEESFAEHVYTNACDAICDVCKKTTRAETFHIDSDGDEACDNCGAVVESEGISPVAISAIVTGSATAVGTGGFSLFWFVIKKKKFIDLIAFFK